MASDCRSQESKEASNNSSWPFLVSFQQRKTRLTSIYVDLRVPVATVKPAIFNGYIFALDIGKYTEDVPVWQWGSHIPGRRPSRCKVRKKNSISGDQQVRVVASCTYRVWKGNDVVEPRRMDLDSILKHSR